MEFRFIIVVIFCLRDDTLLTNNGNGLVLYEIMNKPLLCRCGTKCVVKIFEEQWFLNYNLEKWKKIARLCSKNINFIPSEIKNEFDYVVEWLRQKACARKAGLGTTLPWDKDWIIEALSDSVIYMAYYLISKYVNLYKLTSDQLTNPIFDYIFYGVGDISSLSKKFQIQSNILVNLRNEFLYFYPLDSRHSGRDLVPNHLTFFVFNHSAIFPSNLHPKQIVVNGSVLMDGKKMSKSFGNIIPLRHAVKSYGADPIRLGIMSAAELLQDADFSLELVKSFNERLNRIYNLAQEIQHASDYQVNNASSIEKWMISRLQRTIKTTTNSMDVLRVREALHSIIYLLDIDLQWYNRRTSLDVEDKNSFLKYFTEIRIKLLAPFAPHFCEEIWELFGHGDSITQQDWPVFNENHIDEIAELSEELIKNTIDDVNNILKVTKIQTKKIYIYVSATWKWNIFLSTLEQDEPNLKEMIESSLNNPEYASFKNYIPKFCQNLFKELSSIDDDNKSRLLRVGMLSETEILKELQSFYKINDGVDVILFSEDDSKIHDPKNRSNYSRPLRPAIFLE